MPYKSIREQSWPCCKVGQSQPRIITGTNFVGPRVTDIVYQVRRSLACWFQRRFLKGFCHIWAWWTSWSYDQDQLNKLSFPHPTEAPYEIWLWLAQGFLRRRCPKSLDDRQWQTDRRKSLFTQCKAISVQQNDTYPTVVREKLSAVINCKQMHSVHILPYWSGWSKYCCWNFVQGYWMYHPTCLISLKRISAECSDPKMVKRSLLLSKCLLNASFGYILHQKFLWPTGSWMYQGSGLPYKSVIIMFSTVHGIGSWKTTGVGAVDTMSSIVMVFAGLSIGYCWTMYLQILTLLS